MARICLKLLLGLCCVGFAYSAVATVGPEIGDWVEITEDWMALEDGEASPDLHAFRAPEGQARTRAVPVGAVLKVLGTQVVEDPIIHFYEAMVYSVPNRPNLEGYFNPAGTRQNDVFERMKDDASGHNGMRVFLDYNHFHSRWRRLEGGMPIIDLRENQIYQVKISVGNEGVLANCYPNTHFVWAHKVRLPLNAIIQVTRRNAFVRSDGKTYHYVSVIALPKPDSEMHDVLDHTVERFKNAILRFFTVHGVMRFPSVFVVPTEDQAEFYSGVRCYAHGNVLRNRAANVIWDYPKFTVSRDVPEIAMPREPEPPEPSEPSEPPPREPAPDSRTEGYSVPVIRGALTEWDPDAMGPRPDFIELMDPLPSDHAYCAYTRKVSDLHVYFADVTYDERRHEIAMAGSPHFCDISIPPISRIRDQNAFFQYVLESANKYRVDPSWMLATMAAETSFGSDSADIALTVAGDGGRGLGQFMRGTAAAYGLNYDAPEPSATTAWSDAYNTEPSTNGAGEYVITPQLAKWGFVHPGDDKRDDKTKFLWPIWSPRGATLAMARYMRALKDDVCRRPVRDHIRVRVGDPQDEAERARTYQNANTYHNTAEHDHFQLERAVWGDGYHHPVILFRYVDARYNRGVVPLRSMEERYRQEWKLPRDFAQMWYTPRRRTRGRLSADGQVNQGPWLKRTPIINDEARTEAYDDNRIPKTSDKVPFRDLLWQEWVNRCRIYKTAGLCGTAARQADRSKINTDSFFVYYARYFRFNQDARPPKWEKVD